MADPIVNFFKSTLVGTYSNSATSLTIATGDGALLPDPSTDGAFNLTIFEGLQVTNSTSFEIVRVTAISGDVLTVTRGAENTTPLTIGSSTHSILMSATKKTFDDINTAIDNVNVTTLTGVEELTFDTTGDEEFGLPAGTTAQRPASPSAGYMRWNSTDSRIEFYNGSRWAGLSEIGLQQETMEVAQLSVTANDAVAQSVAQFVGGGRGVFAGGFTTTNTNLIQYITIDTTGNAQDFGDLTVGRRATAGTSDGSRGVIGGGTDGSNARDTLDYITIGTTGNATDFGDLISARQKHASCGSSTRGLFAGGTSLSGGGSTGDLNSIEYITIATPGNGTDFGDLTQTRRDVSGASNETRAIFNGGSVSTSFSNVIDFVTIDTTGNATDFGDLLSATGTTNALCDGSRVVIGGGSTPTIINTIQYIEIDTTGNAQDFGDLTVARRDTGACSNETRGVFGGGNDGSGTDVIDYITIQTLGNAVDFGDLTESTDGPASFSGD